MMRLSILLLSTAILLGCSGVEKEKKEGKELNAYGPAEYLWEKWAYPYDEVDIAYFDKVMDDVRADIKNADMANKVLLNEVSWRLEGPTNLGGRINVITLNPDNEDIIWTGTSAGGVYRSEDDGDTWTTVGDDYFSYMAIGAIAFDPQNTNIIYVGTGDPNVGSYAKNGDGVYKSIDGGDTWTHLGPSEVGIVSEILINPINGDILMASMGIPFFQSDDRGVYKSEDGGETWENILFLSDQAGVSSLVRHPTDLDTLYATGWDKISSNTQKISSGDHTRIYRSYDGGLNWDTLLNGLPDINLVRPAVDVSVSDPSVLYASFVDPDDMQMYGVYKSEDYGDSWIAISIEGIENPFGGSSGFGWYFGVIIIDPTNSDNVSVGGVELHSSTNGGNSWFQSTPDWEQYQVHADMHDLVYNSNGDIYLATDGGLYKSTNDMDNWTDIDEIPNSEFYRITVDPHNDEIYAGGMQDNGTTAGNYLMTEAGINWPRIWGGDGFQCLYNPDNVSYFIATTQNGRFWTYDDAIWRLEIDGFDQNERVAWDAPLIMSSHNFNVVYTGRQKVYKNVGLSTGGSWESISDTLNASDEYYPANRHVITVVDESIINEDVLYAGTSDGKVWVTENGGGSWTDITAGLPDRYVTDMEASTIEEGRVYVTHSGYKDGEQIAHIHVSDDYGQTWTAIGGDLPDFGLNHVEVLNNYGDSVLFVACDAGVYYTTNSGVNWDRVGDNMPIIMVFDIEIDYDANRLVAGTHARSIQSLSLDSLLAINTSIKEHEIVAFSLYPNPASEQIKITSAENIQGSKWKIIDINGKVLKQGLINGEAISIVQFPSGVYFMSLEGANGRTVKKWIKR